MTFFSPEDEAERRRLLNETTSEQEERKRLAEAQAPAAQQLFVKLILEALPQHYQTKTSPFKIPWHNQAMSIWERVGKEYPAGQSLINLSKALDEIADTTKRGCFRGSNGAEVRFETKDEQREGATNYIIKAIIGGIEDIKKEIEKSYKGLNEVDLEVLKRQWQAAWDEVDFAAIQKAVLARKGIGPNWVIDPTTYVARPK